MKHPRTSGSGRRLADMAALLLAFALLAGSCTSGGEGSSTTTVVSAVPSTVQTTGATLRVATIAPESIEPHHAISTRAVDIATLVHEGLTRVGPDGRAEPALAESWATEDLITWTFFIRGDATFSDGTAITSQVVADSWQALASQQTRGRTAYLGIEASIANWADVMAGVEDRPLGLRIVDATTLEVQLESPNPWLAEYLAHPAFAPLPAALLGAQPDDATATAAAAAPMATSGPFLVESGSVDSPTLVARRRSPNADVASVDTIEFIFAESDQAAADLVASGAADIALADTADVPAGLQVEAHPSNKVWYLGFPTPRGPASSPEPRRMLSLTIDRSRFEDELATEIAIHSRSFAPANAIGGETTICRWCRFSPDEAAQIATENEIEQPEDPMAVHVVADSPMLPWAQSIARGWTETTGWPVEVVTHPTLQALVAYLQSGVPSGPFILPWYGDHMGAEAFIEPLFDTAGSDDFIRYSNNVLRTVFTELSAIAIDDPERLLTLNELTLELDQVLAYVPLAVAPRRIVHAADFDLAAIESGVSRVDLSQVRALP